MFLELMKTLAMQTYASRREFLRGSARWTLLTLIAALTVAGVKRGWKAPCLRRGPCAGCVAFESCGLTPARAFKQSQPGF